MQNKKITFFAGILLLLSLLILSCSVDISGAPCSGNENCPRGQYCENGKCVRGTPGDTANITDILSTKDVLQDIPGTTDTSQNPEDTEQITDTSVIKCVNDNECLSDKGKFLCLNNICVPGECRENEDCKVAGFPTCDESHFCSMKCDNETKCGNGYVCCDGLCKTGTCCEDKDCGPNMKCFNNICTKECEKNEECESNKCCDKSICAEKERGCCNNTECESSKYGFSCINYLCSCTSDYECPEGMICDKSLSPPLCKTGCSDIHRCKPGEICCNGVCKKGYCCTSEDCTKPGYPLCKEVNGENICTDICQPLSQNPCKSPDNKYRCCLQGDNLYRCVIANCCSNDDCKLPDKPYCEKGLETPDCVNICKPENGIKCGFGYVCCYAFNGYMCFAGDCCETKDCNDNKKCIGHHCVEEDCKSEPSICGTGEKCCPSGQLEGVCYKGECCDDVECSTNSNGFKCLLDSFKCGCTTKSDCKAGYVCKNNVCVFGDCVTDADCKDEAKPVCINNKCSPCQDGYQCKNAQKGDICCSGYCKYGNCCSSLPDCQNLITKPVCREGYCSPCGSSAECSSQNLGDKCCTRGVLAGDCYSGTCCSSYDCLEAGSITKPICHTTDYSCYPCASDTECINEFKDTGLKCCAVKNSPVSGSCYKGECCDDTQCKTYQSRPKCDLKTNMCVECLTNTDCGIIGIGYICCNNQCVRGECCSNADCTSQNRGNYCYQYHCRTHCAKPQDCSLSPDGSYCCTNITTSPFPFCIKDQSGKCCKSDNDCGALDKCCFGICEPKAAVCY